VVQIAAGEAVVLASLPTRVAISTQPALPPSWREGRLAYRAEPLKYVVSDLNRYSTNQIIISDPKVGEFEYSGTVTPGALDDWVVALTQAFPVTVEKQTDGAYVISAR
jgi:transmembrane sensor